VFQTTKNLYCLAGLNKQIIAKAHPL